MRRYLAPLVACTLALVAALPALATPPTPPTPPAIIPTALIDFAGTATGVISIMGLAFVAAAGVVLTIVIARKAVSMFRGG